MKKFTHGLSAAGVFALLAGCAATQLSDVTKDPAYNPAGMKRVFVVAFVKTDRGQKMLENEYVHQLNDLGKEAVASNTLIARDTTLTREAWNKLIADNHWDTVVLTRLLEMQETEKEIGMKFHAGGVGESYNFYSMYANTLYQPSSYVRERTAFLETQVIDVASGKIVWSAKSKTEISPGGDHEVEMHKFVQLLIREARSKP